ncbi:MAG: metal ABC transporter ATP-binding protein [Peptococcaceae bacterium]|nr:metal ABC transporter ATP-binding protein [Peptococcaceae bacterium]
MRNYAALGEMVGIHSSARVLELQNVSIQLGRRTVINNLNLVVRQGDFLGVIGPNGAGKTTLMRLILGLIKPSQGMVRLFGASPSAPGDHRHMVGYLPQKQRFDDRFPVSALDVVMMGRIGCIGLLRWPSREDRKAALSTLCRVGFNKEDANRPIGELSGGQQQLVFLARALCSHTRLLVLDEPTAALDLTAQNRFYRIVKELQNDLGLTVIIVSHDLPVVAGYADRLLCLDGYSYIVGTPREVLASRQVARAYGRQIAQIFN